MELYKIIANQEALENYIEKYLISNSKQERYYFALRSRRKYIDETIRKQFSDAIDIKKSYSNKKDIVSKIQQLEVRKGLYTDRQQVLPNDCLTISLYANPRDIIKAKKQVLKDLISDESNQSPLNIALSAIQKSKGTRVYTIFDFDVEKSDTMLNTIINLFFQNINENIHLHIIETRGGYHAYIKLSTLKNPNNKKWYDLILKSGLCDANSVGDIASALVGTYQGGFEVKLIYTNW